MFNWLNKKLKSNSESSGEQEYQFKWLEPGENNPFPFTVLDVRDLTWNVTAYTSDRSISEAFLQQRQVDGKEYLHANIEDSVFVDCDLRFPHNGNQLDGIIFKAESMEEKWDIYIYDSTLIFCRSWTGIPHYRAKVEISPSSIRINQIETSSEQAEIAPQVVYFLAASHAMGITIPHPISKDVSDDPMDIASHSFSHFGRFACFATREDVTQVVLSDFEGSS